MTDNDDMERRAISSLRATWQAIGPDTLQCMVDCGEVKSIERAVMTRSQVIESVTSCGFTGGYPMSHGGDNEAVEWLEKQPRKRQEQICKKAFPHSRYYL